MKVTKEERPVREVLLSIELEPQDLEPYLDRAYKRVVQQTNVPGFRRGKAPRHIVEQFLGREYLLTEALDFVVPEATNKAVQEQELDVGGTPKVELAQRDPVVLKATVPLTPVVELGAYRQLRLDEEPVEVTEEQVDRLLEELRYNLTPWEPADRPLQFGDLVNLDVLGSANGQEMVNNSAVDYVPQQGSDQPVTGFSEALQGLHPGETKEFTLDLPSDYPNGELAGKSCHFQVTVKEVKEKRLAELDDEFAKSVGDGYESLEALRNKVREDVTREAEREARRRYEEQVVQQVIEGTTVQVSPLVMEQEVDHLLREQEEALKQRRVTMEQYLQRVGKNEEQLRDELRPTAEARVKRALVIGKAIELEDIQVSQEEVQQEIDSMVQESGQRGESVRQLFGASDGRESLRRLLLTRKTVQRLADIARGHITNETPGTTEEETPAETTQTTDATDGGTQDG